MITLTATKGICPKCNKEVIKTHRMQQLDTQMIYHLRTHGMTIMQAKIASRQAQYS